MIIIFFTAEIIMSIKSKMHTFFRHTSILMAIEGAIAIGLSYYIGQQISIAYHYPLAEVAGLWCSISAIIVINVIAKEALKAAGFRILGSILGGLVTLVIDSMMGYSFWSLFVGIFIAIVIASLLHIKKAFRLAALTVSIITIVGMAIPHVPIWINVLSRVFQSVIGVAVAIIVVYLFAPIRRGVNLQKSEEEIWRWFE